MALDPRVATTALSSKHRPHRAGLEAANPAVPEVFQWFWAVRFAPKCPVPGARFLALRTPLLGSVMRALLYWGSGAGRNELVGFEVDWVWGRKNVESPYSVPGPSLS